AFVRKPPPSIEHKGSSDRGLHGGAWSAPAAQAVCGSLQQDRMELSIFPYRWACFVADNAATSIAWLCQSSEFDSTPTALHSESERFWSSSDGAVGGANAAPSPSPGCHCGPYFTLIIASRILSKRVGSSLT